MRRRELPVIALAKTGSGKGSLGTLSIHLENRPCKIRCPFCYLGQRVGDLKAADAATSEHPGQTQATHSFVDCVGAALADERWSYKELAVAVSEPGPDSPQDPLPALASLFRVASARGAVCTVTTTPAVVETLGERILSISGLESASGSGQKALVSRLNLSLDPIKWPKDLAACLGQIRRLRPFDLDLVLIVTLSSPSFAAKLFSGLLADLLALPEVDRVALSALKPPPAWCDRSFWLRSLAQIAPLLDQHLDRRLFLDCYVAARILHLGDCPARPDLSPQALLSPESGQDALAFRSCVYQQAADFVLSPTERFQEEFTARLAGFSAPAFCPFPIP